MSQFPRFPRPRFNLSRLLRCHRLALLFLATILLLPRASQAATVTWTGAGATNNWSEAANWAGGVVPGAADAAIFDGTSVKAATLDVNVNVAGIAINAGYTGTITQAAGIAVTVGASNFSQAAATFTGGNSAIDINGTFSLSAGTFTSTTGVLSVSGNFTISGGAFNEGTGTVTFDGTAATIDVVTSDTFNNLTFNSGTNTVALGDTLVVGGTLTLTDGLINTGSVAAQGNINQDSTFDGGSATLLINGTGPQTFSGTATSFTGGLPVLDINKSAGTLTLAGTIRATSNWTYTAGTLDAATSTVIFAGGTITGSHTLNAVEITGATTVAVGTTLTLNSNLTMPSAVAFTVGGTVLVNGALILTDGSIAGAGSVQARGNITEASTFDGGLGTLLINGTGPQTFTGSATVSGSTVTGRLPRIDINKTAGTLTLSGTIGTANNWTYTAGTLDAGTSTLAFDGGTITGTHTINNLYIADAVTVATGTTLTVNGTLTENTGLAFTVNGVVIVNGTATLTDGSIAGTGSVQARGNITQASTLDGGAGTLLVNGTGAQTFTGSATVTAGFLANLNINKASGTLTLSGTIRTSRNWTYTAGTLAAGTSTVVFVPRSIVPTTVTGSHTLNNVRIDSFIASAEGMTVAAGTTLTVAGALTLDNSSTGAMTVTVNGTVIVNGTLTLTDGTIAGTGSVQPQGNITQASTFGGGTGTLLINGTGAQTLTGSATLTAGALPNLSINKPGGTLTLSGTIRTLQNWTYTAGTLDAGTSTVVFVPRSVVPTTIAGSHTLNNVRIDSNIASAETITVAAGTTLTVSGALTLDNSSTGGMTVTVNGVVIVNGALALTDGSIAGTGSVQARGNITQASTFAGGPGTLLINGTGAQTLTGSATVTAGSLPNLSINKPGGTLNLAGTIRTVQSWTYTAGTVSAGTSIVVFAGTETVTSAGMSFYDLIVNAGTATLGSSLDVVHDLSIPAGTLTTSSSGHAVTIGGNLVITGTLAANGSAMSVGGNFTNDGTFLASTSTVTFSGSAAQTLGGLTPTAFQNITVNNASGLTLLTSPLTVNGTLTFTAGNITTGLGRVIVSATGSVTRTSGHVFGNLQKSIPAGPGVVANFEIGDATNYAPVLASFGVVTTAGDLTARTTAGDHPDIANAGLNPSKTVNRYWTMTNSGVAFDAYSATFNFVLADIDAGADPNSFIVSKRNGTWTQPTVGARTATSTQATGMTAFSDFTVGEPAADLSVTKSDSPDPVTVGGTLTYTVLVSNGGPLSAAAVTLTDTLPAGVTFGTATSTQGSCTQAGGTVTCAIGMLANGGSVTVTITVTPTSAGLITNTATVSSATPDPDPLDNTATASTTVGASADLSASKSDAPDPVAAGSTLTYAVVVTNGGPSGATGVTLTDTLPAGVTFGTATSTQGSCTQAGGTVTCAIGALANGGSATVTITVTPTTGGTISNSASVAGNDSDPNAGNNTSTASTTVTPPTDLFITKTDGQATATPGSAVTYTIIVANGGPGPANGAVVADTFPASLTGVAWTCTASAGSSCAAASGSGNITTAVNLLSSGTATFAATGTVSPGATGTLANTASVSPPTGVTDPNPGNNTATDTDTLTPSADLAVSKSASPLSVAAGQNITYSISVANNGPSDVASVVASDATPANTTFQSLTSPAGWGCTTPPVGGTGTVTCTAGSLSAVASASFTLVVQVNAGTPNGTVISNTATASSGTADANSSNNSGNASSTVNPAGSADLAVTKSASPLSVAAGQNITYSISVANNGPSDAASVVASDATPANTTFQSLTSPAGWGCTTPPVGGTGTVTCSAGSLSAVASASFTLVVQVNAGTPNGTVISNTATASSATTEPNSANNTATATSTVAPAADLSLTKSDSPDPVAAGGTLTYTVVVTNGGPAGASGVTVTDTLPAGVTFGTATSTQGSCTQAGGTVTCSMGALPNGASATVTITVTPTAAGTVTNTATVSSNEIDLTPANNTAAATTTVGSSADLSVTKSDSPDPVALGSPVTYTIVVTNGGPSAATAVTLTDTLPAGVTFGTVASTQGSCTQGGGTVTCAIGILPSAAAATVTITVTPTSAGFISNTAAVSSDIPDPNSANNTATATTGVGFSADLSVTKSGSPDPVAVGSRLTYTLVVMNTGPSSATDLLLTDTLPAAVTFETATSTQGSCTQGDGTVTCAIGVLGSGAAATVTIAVTPTSAGAIANSAAVAAAESDPNLANNTSTAATTVDPDRALPALVTLPVVASLHGLPPTFFHSYVHVFNTSGSRPAVVTATYRCAGGDCVAPVQTFTVLPRQLLSFSDIVTGLFASPETWGAVEFSSTEEIIVTSRLYTPSQPAPTTGMFVPGLRPADAARTPVLAGLSHSSSFSSGFRTNVGIYNGNDVPQTVTFTFFDGLNRSLGEIVEWVGARQPLQLNDPEIFARLGVAGDVPDFYCVVRGDGSRTLFAYAGVIDNQSQDPILVTGRDAEAPAAAKVTLPVVASLHGRDGTFFHSDVRVLNLSATTPAEVTARYLCFAASCGNAEQRFVVLPGQMRAFDDIVATLFLAPETGGAVEFVSAEPIVVTSRLYTPSRPEPTIGFFVPGLSPAEAAPAAVLTSLSHSPDSSKGFRTNVGVYNGNDAPLTVTLRLFDGMGNELGRMSRRFAAGEAFQINDIFGFLGVRSSVESAYCLVQGDGVRPIFTYAGVIDNQSQDPILIVGRRDVAAPPIGPLATTAEGGSPP